MSLHNVVYVNQRDKVVGSGTIDNAYATGSVLRIVRIFIANNKGELLLQKRAKRAFSSSKWDQCAGGHVDAGETYLQAAKRELFEEMGIRGVKLTKINKFYTEDQPFKHVRKRFNLIYYGTYSGPVVPDKIEVADYAWASLPQLNNWIQKNAEDFTAGFLVSYKNLLNSGVLDKFSM